MKKEVVLLAIFASILITSGFACAIVSHSAPQINPGNFTSGNFTFPNSLFVNGKMGIGVANPLQALSVAGDAAISGYLSLGNYLNASNICIGSNCKTSWPNGVWNSRVSVNNTVTQIGGGYYPSLTIGVDGLPVIAYEGTGGLTVAKCLNLDCSSSTITALGSNENRPSIAIAPDGLPVIAYYSSGYLKVAKCGNVACSSGNTISAVDSPIYAGTYISTPSLVIGSDGLPVIAYINASGGAYRLKVAKCGNIACSSGNTLTVVDTASVQNGESNSIAIGADGLPIISYYTYTGLNLRVAKCGNLACSSGNTLTSIDTAAGDTGWFTSITIGLDSMPVVSYYRDDTIVDLKFIHCTTDSCSASTIRSLDTAGWLGFGTSITLGNDGFPIIAHADHTSGKNSTIRVVKCGDATCATTNLAVTGVGSGGFDQSSFTSIAIGSDGLPVIAFDMGTKLYVAHCASSTCAPYWTRR